MSDTLVNDAKRLERAGCEISGTNRKLIASASRIINLIFEIVPEDLPTEKIGFGYRFSGDSLWKSGEGQQQYHFHRNKSPRLGDAHEFANDVAKGFLKQLCKTLEEYSSGATDHLRALEDGETLLKNKFRS